MHTEELAQALRLKDEYLANMSHELRTPLTSILSVTEALMLGMLGPLTEQQHSSMSIIEESSRHLLAVINDVLDLAKIDAGKMPLNREVLDIADSCQSVVRMVNPAIAKKELQLIVQVDERAQFITADEVRLTQLLVNLLNNAVKFTPVGGRIGLTIMGDRAAKTIAFTVWDTGPGIAPAMLPLLFQPFVQLDNQQARHNTGTGLGLSLVRRITELHGGQVSVDSILGEGTRFIVTLPWDVDLATPRE